MDQTKSTHYDFLLANKSQGLIPKGLCMNPHINFTSSDCSMLWNQTLKCTSHHLLDLLIHDTFNAIKIYTQDFLSVCRILISITDLTTYALILCKLNDMACKLKDELLVHKHRKLQKNMRHHTNTAKVGNDGHVNGCVHKRFVYTTTSQMHPLRPGHGVDMSTTPTVINRPTAGSFSQRPTYTTSTVINRPTVDYHPQRPICVTPSNPQLGRGPTSRPTPARTRMYTTRRRFVKRSRHRGKLPPITTNQNVVNLSSHSLTVHEQSVLSRGLKFCPTPTSVDQLELRTDLDKFERRLRLKVFYSRKNTKIDDSNKDTDTNTYDPKALFNHPLLKRQSTFTPNPGQDPFLDAYITAVRADVINGIKAKTYRNVSKEEHKALHDIKNNRNIVIKEADKGSSVVIQDREQYITECNRQLGNTKYYKKLDVDPTSKFEKQMNKALEKAVQAELIDDSMRYALSPKRPTPGRFYTLPKIHKQYDNIPTGRPIVSGNGTVTEKVSLFVDHYLKPHVSQLDSYVQDDMDFLRKIEKFNERGPLPPDVILCTMDVSSLYTNIPTQEAIDACRSFLQHDLSPEKLDAFCDLMKLVLTQNNFTFNGDHFLQIFGTSMGTKMAPSMACLFMGILENRLLESVQKKPLLWTRFIDDVFFLWTHGPAEFKRFFKFCNTFHVTIKFTSALSNLELPFLAVLVYIKDGYLQTDLYSKPTDTHQFLHWTSCHPKHTKSSLPYSMAFRLNRICSTPERLNVRVDELKGYLKSRGYPNGLVESQINKALAIPRSEALKPTLKSSNTGLERVPMVITYHPSLPKLVHIVRRHLPILHSSPECKRAIPNPPMIAYRRSSNTKDLVVRSTLPPLQPPPEVHLPVLVSNVDLVHTSYTRTLAQLSPIPLKILLSLVLQLVKPTPSTIVCLANQVT